MSAISEATGVASLRDRVGIVAMLQYRKAIRNTLDRAIGAVDRILHSTGLTAAFLGADGAGKSAVAWGVRARLQPMFHTVRAVHSRPQFGRASTTENDDAVASLHGQPARRTVGSLVKLCYHGLDYGIGTTRLLFAYRVRSGLVRFDRYAHDIGVDPRWYRHGGPKWAARLLGRLVSQPDIVFVLIGDPDRQQRRKQEISPMATAVLCVDYERMAGRSGWKIVDAGKALAVVVGQVEQTILDFLKRRAAACTLRQDDSISKCHRQ